MNPLTPYVSRAPLFAGTDPNERYPCTLKFADRRTLAAVFDRASHDRGYDTLAYLIGEAYPNLDERTMDN